MARRRKGQRAQDGGWYTTVGGKLHKLGTADQPRAEIDQAYYEVLAKGEKPSKLTVAWLAEEFLEEVPRDRSPSTYEWYKRQLNSCVRSAGSKPKADSLTPAMVA